MPSCTRRQSGPVPIAPYSKPSSSTIHHDHNVIRPHTYTRKSKTVKSCTCCRQLKIKCNASVVFPSPCSNCAKKGKSCEIDPLFKPVHNTTTAHVQLLPRRSHSPVSTANNVNSNNNTSAAKHKASQLEALKTELDTLRSDIKHLLRSESILANDEAVLRISTTLPSPPSSRTSSVDDEYDYAHEGDVFILNSLSLSKEKALKLLDTFLNEYSIYLPVSFINLSSLPIDEIYNRSPLLFWSICLTSCLSPSSIFQNNDGDGSENENDLEILYLKISNNIINLIPKFCLFGTSKSEILDIYALLILSSWPLPHLNNDKSYRFVSLSKTLANEIGINIGCNSLLDGDILAERDVESSFNSISIKSKNDLTSLNVQLWNGIFFLDQSWCANLGYSLNSLPDFTIEQFISTNINDNLKENSYEYNNILKWKKIMKLIVFQSKLVQTVSCSTSNITGLISSKERVCQLLILNSQLSTIFDNMSININSIDNINDLSILITYHYIKLILCSYGFLNDIEYDDQLLFVPTAFESSIKICELLKSFIDYKNLNLNLNSKFYFHQLPIFIRNPFSFACLTLFKLHLSSMLSFKSIKKSRDVIISSYNLLTTSKISLKFDDISRTVSILEKLNLVILNHPEVIIGDSVISHMSGHSSASLVYELIWCIQHSNKLSNESIKSLKDSKKIYNSDKDTGMTFNSFDELFNYKNLNDNDKLRIFLGKPFQLPFKRQSDLESPRTPSTQSKSKSLPLNKIVKPSSKYQRHQSFSNHNIKSAQVSPILPKSHSEFRPILPNPKSKTNKNSNIISLPHINQLSNYQLDFKKNDDVADQSSSLTDLSKYNIHKATPKINSLNVPFSKNINNCLSAIQSPTYLSPQQSPDISRRNTSIYNNNNNHMEVTTGSFDALIQGVNWVERNSI